MQEINSEHRQIDIPQAEICSSAKCFLIDSGICHHIMLRSYFAAIMTQTVLIYY